MPPLFPLFTRSKTAQMKNCKLYFLPLLLGLSAGCTSLTEFGILPGSKNNLPLRAIANISSQPSPGSTVYIRGQVIHQAPFLDSGAYQLEDETGAIWVTTENNLPVVGDDLIIKGQIVYQSIPIEEQEWGEVYIQELRKLERQPAPSAE